MSLFAMTSFERENRNSDASSAWNRKRELDRRLDQALEDTFPASDPVSFVTSPGAERFRSA
jgi:hypothetical protein